MKQVRKSSKNLSWQAARQKIINHVLAKKANYSTHSPFQNATDASGRVMNALDQYGWVSPAAQQESNSSVIRQMVDIMGELGCKDLEELVFKYLVKLININ